MKARCALASVITEKAARYLSLRPLLSPGGYLLSRDLSSDYHRRADVSLPGSEWDRVGPSGYDHQASVGCGCSAYAACASRFNRLPGSSCCCLWALFLLFLLAVFAALPALAFSRLTSAWLVVCFFLLCVCSHSRLSSVLSKACHQGSDRGLSDVSSARLNTLLQLHLRPINVVVFHAPIGRTHLGRDLALRCFQRLFLPHLATRPCS